MSNSNSLTTLGWQNFFQQQISLEEWDTTFPARVIEQHRSQLNISAVTNTDDLVDVSLPVIHSMPPMTVGDWLLVDEQQGFVRLLDRKTAFSRKSAGTQSKQQIIAANVDTAFIVCALNQDFNLNRIERYLALVNESGADPVVILSKCDLVDNPEDYRAQVQKLDPLLIVETVNCLDADSIASLSHWLQPGKTIALLGSSGVGKSTLTNTLLGNEIQTTQAIRADDDKGRHTTTSRSLFQTQQGALILDTPGMRELQLSDCETGIAETFADIESLADSCRFADCQHQSEPGCKVQEALNSGELDERRLNNYLKLKREEQINSASLAEKRASDKALGKFYKKTLSEAYRLKGR